MEDISKLVYGSGGDKEFIERRHPHSPKWTRQTWRLGVIGASGSGKTFMIGAFLKNCVAFKKIYILSATHQPTYEWLKYDYLAKAEEALGPIVHIYDDIDEFPDVDDFPDNIESGTIVLIDDFLVESKNPKLQKYFVNGRHKGIACIFLAQDLFAINRIIRQQFTHLAVFKQPADTKAEQIYREFAQDLDKRTFLRFYHTSTRPRHGFLWISLNEPELKDKYRNQFTFPLEV